MKFHDNCPPPKLRAGCAPATRPIFVVELQRFNLPHCPNQLILPSSLQQTSRLASVTAVLEQTWTSQGRGKTGSTGIIRKGNNNRERVQSHQR